MVNHVNRDDKPIKQLPLQGFSSFQLKIHLENSFY